MRGQLIPDWPLAWRFSSVQAAILLAILSAVQAEVLPMVQPVIPEAHWPLVSGAMALAIIVLRLRAQPALEPEREQLQLDRDDASPAPEAPSVDADVEAMAMHLYLSTSPRKDWTEVSPESKAKWRKVAMAALAAQSRGARMFDPDTGEEYF